MARRSTPWFRKGRGWYVQHRGKQVALGKDKAEAFRRFHALMQKPDDAVAQGDTFAAICDEFLEWTLQHRARRTYDWYVALLQPFAAFLKAHGFVGPAEGLRPLHVRRWLEQRWHHAAAGDCGSSTLLQLGGSHGLPRSLADEWHREAAR